MKLRFPSLRRAQVVSNILGRNEHRARYGRASGVLPEEGGLHRFSNRLRVFNEFHIVIVGASYGGSASIRARPSPPPWGSPAGRGGLNNAETANKDSVHAGEGWIR